MNLEQYKSTRRYRRARVLTIFLLGIPIGAFVHRTDVRWVERGRDAFLTYQMQYQSRRFDRFVMHPHGLVFQIINAIAALAIIFGIYELLVAGFTAILPARTPEV